jgi:hypothetical protein
MVEQRKKWAAKEAPYNTRLWEWIFAAFYKGLRALKIKLTIYHFVFGSIRLVSSAAIAAIPIVYKLYKDTENNGSNKISWAHSILVTGAIVILIWYNKLYDWILKIRKDRDDTIEQELALSSAMSNATSRLTRKGEITISEQDINKIISDMLKAIRLQTRLILHDFEEHYLETSLLVLNEDGKQMVVAHRAIGNRPLDSKINIEECMAYYVSISQKEREVNDFKWRPGPFEKRGISSEKPKYRSILLLPLIYEVSGNDGICKGVVSIDSSRPYEFWGSGKSRIVIRIQPYLNILCLLLSVSHNIKGGA